MRFGGLWRTIVSPQVCEGTRSKGLTDVHEHSLTSAFRSGIRGAPTPGPKLFHRVPLTSPRRYAMPWFMSGPNRAVVQRTWSLYALAAQAGNAQDDAARRVYGPRFTYEEGFQPGGGISRFLPVLLMSVVYYLSLAALFFLPPVSAVWLAAKVPDTSCRAKGSLAGKASRPGVRRGPLRRVRCGVLIAHKPAAPLTMSFRSEL